MALTLGTNCGFVTIAPTGDPTATNLGADTKAWAFKIVAPSGAIKVTEIGWYCENATEESNFEVGIYDHNAGDNNPENLLAGAAQTNAKGTAAGWKVATGLNIEITEGSTYWLAFQLDNTATQTLGNVTSLAGQKTDRKDLITALPNPWGTNDGSITYLLGIYAVWEAAPTGTNTQINIGDAWKGIAGVQINIGDVWKTVEGMQINIGDVWKTIF